MRRTFSALLAAVTLFGAGAASAQPGSANQPYVIRMRRGTDEVALMGVLVQNRDCCVYRFVAHAGQTLNWRLTGPAVRIVLTYPDGHVDGPGVPNSVPLPMTGTYLFSVSPNLMADGAFGRYHLWMRIPPLPPMGAPHYPQ
jgi:hypothetical protein